LSPYFCTISLHTGCRGGAGLGGSQGNLEVLLCGVLQGDRQEVRPALGQGNGQDGGLSLQESCGQEVGLGLGQGDAEQVWFGSGQGNGEGIFPGPSECSDEQLPGTRSRSRRDPTTPHTHNRLCAAVDGRTCAAHTKETTLTHEGCLLPACSTGRQEATSPHMGKMRNMTRSRTLNGCAQPDMWCEGMLATAMRVQQTGRPTAPRSVALLLVLQME